MLMTSLLQATTHLFLTILLANSILSLPLRIWVSLNYFLGLEATTTFDGLFISQLKYAQDILTWAQLLNNKPVHTPWLFHNTCLLMVLCCRILHFIDLLLVLSSIWPSPVRIFLMLSTMSVNFSTLQLKTTFLLSNAFFAMLKACYTLASPFIPLLLLVLYRLP